MQGGALFAVDRLLNDTKHMSFREDSDSTFSCCIARFGSRVNLRVHLGFDLPVLSRQWPLTWQQNHVHLWPRWKSPLGSLRGSRSRHVKSKGGENKSMSDQVKEILDFPRDFFKDGAFFINRCTKPSKRGKLTGAPQGG